MIRSPIRFLTKLSLTTGPSFYVLFSYVAFFSSSLEIILWETHAYSQFFNGILYPAFLLTDLFNPIDVVRSFVDRFKFTYTQFILNSMFSFSLSTFYEFVQTFYFFLSPQHNNSKTQTRKHFSLNVWPIFCKKISIRCTFFACKI